MSEVKSKTIIPKRATKTKFASSESVLKEGEIALIYPDTGPGTGAAKLVSGDGATVAKNLPIAIDGEAIDELRESLDIAKKIIPITLTFAGWKSINGDNSAPYVQTVINEELKSSMNPDLVSMLDENATPDEQDVYNKNLAIISQGVGTVNNGSITYKVYKLPSADITIGLTRLGGVKEVETASGVDDVKVGGVSVVKDKVAEIPAMPDTSNLVPYKGATTNVNLGGKHWLYAGKLLSEGDVEVYSYSTDSGLKIHSGDSESCHSDFLAHKWVLTNQDMEYVRLQGLVGGTGYLSLFDPGTGLYLELTPSKLSFSEEGVISKLADPTEPDQAATKKYVDSLIKTTTIAPKKRSIPSRSSLTLETPITLPELTGFTPKIIGFYITESTPEGMWYNYGLTSEGNLFMTYFNVNSTTSKNPTDKEVVIHYVYVPKNA